MNPAPPPGSRLTADDFTAHPLFLSTVEEWAVTHGVDPAVASRRAQERLLQVRQRGEQEHEPEEWAALLRDLLAVEGS